MPPSPLPGSSLVWMLTLWALAFGSIRLVSAVPSTVIVDNPDPRVQYTPAEKWFHDPSKVWSNPYNGSYTWAYGASAIFRFTGIGINITGPMSPNQALRMILLNNVSMGTCDPENLEDGPPTSFFLKDLDYGDHIVEVRHVDTRPNRLLTIDAFRVTVDNDLYPTSSGLNSQSDITIMSASVSADQSSDPSYKDGPQVGPSAGVVALIITLPLLFFCVVCPIVTCFWIRRRQQRIQEASTDGSEKALEPGDGKGHSRNNTSSNLSEFGVEALTIQEQLSAPPTMGPSMTAAMLDARDVVNTPPRRRQLAVTGSSGSAADYPAGVLHQPTHAADHTTDEHPSSFLAGSATLLPPLGDPSERRRSRSPTAFFARLSHNFVTAFGGPGPQEAAEADGATDEESTAESWSTPMTLGVRLNHQPTATAASSTLHGSDSEGSGKGKWLRYSVASYSAMTGESTRAPSFSSRASVGHSQGGQSQGQGGLRRGEQSPTRALDTLDDVSPPGSAQSGQLSISSVSTGMVTALTHQTMDHRNE